MKSQSQSQISSILASATREQLEAELARRASAPPSTEADDDSDPMTVDEFASFMHDEVGAFRHYCLGRQVLECDHKLAKVLPIDGWLELYYSDWHDEYYHDAAPADDGDDGAA